MHGSKEFIPLFGIKDETQRISGKSQEAEKNILSNERLSMIKQVKLNLPGMHHKNQSGENIFGVFFEKLQQMTNIEAVGFFDLCGVSEELLEDMLFNLPNSPKLKTLYIENYQKLYTGTHVTQFIQKLIYVCHVVLIDSRIDCINENGGKIKTMHVQNSLEKHLDQSDDAVSSVISKNSDSLIDLAVHTKSLVNFISYLFWALYHIDWLKLEKLFVQYLNSNSEPLMTYEMIEREREDVPAQIKLTMVATAITMNNLTNVINVVINGKIAKDLYMETNTIAHLIICVTMELSRNELVVLKNLILNIHFKSQLLEVKTKNLTILQQIWSNVGNEICEIVNIQLLLMAQLSLITSSIKKSHLI